ncbi:hypothetical protein C8A01DRAFT_17473 [Parachaetomium inaequale]|uniref:Dystroglycan-type cadherin-like domain-containing protein n=1 Tax=Parachaetomium inaequale TaxID=2588326 RepID=A0AAN6SPN7_9PEZI|nr:hypothetical protein C8A01DRAFT_17473 [Parachaetomium inaequale]
MASPVVAWATALLFAGLSTASPVISFPINSQVPVARLGQPFSFVFSPSTFSSSSPMTYSLSNPPKWLSIDSDARRLFGTPGQDDVAPGRVAGVPLNLVATDDSGSTTLTATLVVSASSGPRVEIPLQNQVPDFGTFSSPSSILSAPGKGFSFKLDPNTFSKPAGAAISYYATMADNTPLPAWISFDPTNLSLSGQTPPAESLVQPPQHFPFRVIATDVVGFAGAAMDFDIVVGNHQLTADETTVVLNATHGALLSYTGLRDTVNVDGKPAAPGSVVLASTSHTPAWLSVNKHTWQMTGVPPDSAESTNFTVTLRDTFSNTLNLTVLVDVTGDKAGLFTADSPNLTITPGKPFSFDLRPYLSSPGDTEVSFETNPSYPWIQLNSSTSTIFGDAPQGLKDSAVNVKIKAKSRKSKKSASLSFDIAIRAVSDGKGSTPTDSGADPTESSDGQRSLASDSLGNRRFNPVLLAVLLPLLLLLALAVCALFWYFRRRKDSQRPGLSTRDISGPLPRTFVAGPDVSHSLPDFTKRFGKSFSADDVFGPTPADSPDMYDGIAEHSPFRPSRTWSTVPTTDEWVDETVESLALSPSTSSQQQQQQQQQQNWTVLQESPVVTSRDASASGRGLPDIASSVRLGQAQEGGGEGKGEVEVPAGLPPASSGLGAAATVEMEGGQKREASGLTRKSQSIGVSLRSEGSRSDYAAFI